MTLLLIIIYVAFIGLGVPDSLIGSAWPAIHAELELPVEAVSCITLLISGCTVLSGIFSAGLLNRFGTAKITAVSTVMTAAALVAFSFAPSFIWTFPCAIVLGLGAGAIDAGLNNFVALHFKASHMNFLHCFYGVGVSLSPYLMSVALGNTGWRDGYRYAFLLQGAIAMLLIFSLPLWKKATAAGESAEEVTPVNLPLSKMFKMPTVRTVWIIMLATNMLEYACGTWGSTYLVKAKGFLPEHGALGLTVYYAGMALGRFFSGLLAGKIKTWNRIWLGSGILALSAVVLILPTPGVVSAAALFFFGLGNGSIYPNLIHLTPYNFSKEYSQSVMGSQIAFAYVGVMLSSPLVGAVTGAFGIDVYPLLLTALLVCMVLALWHFTSLLKKENKYDKAV